MSESMNGLYVFGECLGVKATPWRNDPNKYNYRLGIKDTFINSWGQTVADVFEIDIPLDHIQTVKAQAELLNGKKISVRIRAVAKQGGRNGAFLLYYVADPVQLVEQKQQRSLKTA